MKEYYKDAAVSIYHGDCREVLGQLEPESVQCVVTSPPYWGLRDYGLEPLVWLNGQQDGGVSIEECNQIGHVWETAARTGMTGGLTEKQVTNAGSFHNVSQHDTCQSCGAWRGSLGLEPTPELYVEHLVEVFRGVWRVLRKDGTCFLNLGDAYFGGVRRGDSIPSLKPKDLVGIPWRVALALQADGWYLRSDIIWAKPNPMPESVKDRPTRSHEYVFLLSKSPRYYYDADAIREPVLQASLDREAEGFKAAFKGRHTMPGEHRPHSDDHNNFSNPAGRNKRSVWTITDETDNMTTWFGKLGFCRRCNGLKAAGNGWEHTIVRDTDVLPETTEQVLGSSKPIESPTNSSSVPSHEGLQSTIFAETGDVSTQPTLSPSLSESTSCEATRQPPGMQPKPIAQLDTSMMYPIPISEVMVNGNVVPVCACDADDNSLKSVWRIPTQSFPEAHFAVFPEKLVEPCVLAGCPEGGVVLDPFCGTGTTGKVAWRLGRKYIGIDVSEKYMALNDRRLTGAQREFI